MLLTNIIHILISHWIINHVLTNFLPVKIYFKKEEIIMLYLMVIIILIIMLLFYYYMLYLPIYLFPPLRTVPQLIASGVKQHRLIFNHIRIV